MQEVIDIILEKKELSNIHRKLVEIIIKENIDKKIKKLIFEKRFKTKEFKAFVKLIRAQLRRQFGAFQNPKINRTALIENKDYIGLLKSHQSSKERLPYYESFYNDLFSITGKPRSIIDIGCGMNPISFEFMDLKKVYYFSLDISKYDLEIIGQYFKQKKIKHDERVFDAVHDEYDFKKKFDICFVLKLFEILETTKSHRLTEDIIKKLPAEYIVASFPTRTIGNLSMTRKRRIWFEVMLARLKKNFKIIEIPNEIFYVILNR